MITQFYRSEKLDSDTAVYQFKNLIDFELFIQDVSKRFKSRIGTKLMNEFTSDARYRSEARDKDWFGTTDWQLAKKTDTFLFSEKLSNELVSFRKQTIHKDVRAIDQKKKLIFTERELGIFSFDLASLGLIRVYEYWSPLLHRMVDANDVRSKRNDEGQLYFYHIYKRGIPRHEVKYEPSKVGFYSTFLAQVVSSDLLEKEFDVEIIDGKQVDVIKYFYPEQKEISEHVVEQRQKTKDGAPEFQTTFKKSFIYIERAPQPLPKIELVINASYSASRSAEKQIFWAALAGIAIAERLSDAGISYRISLSLPIRGEKKETYSYITLKEDTEPLNINRIATAVSDGRFFRGIGFTGYVATFEEMGWGDFLMEYGLGYPIDDAAKIKSKYMKFLSMQNNPIDREAASNPDTKIVFAGALSKEDAVRQYNEVMNKIEKLKTA